MTQALDALIDWFQYGPGIGYSVGALLLLLCWLLIRDGAHIRAGE